MEIETLKAVLFLNRYAVSGRTRPIIELLQQGISPNQILNEWCDKLQCQDPDKLRCLQADFDPEREIEKCLDQDIRLLCYTDPAYPALLKNIADPPLLLYVKGTLSTADDSALAMVGSRQATAYGIQQARAFGYAMANAGWTIVSGLARGIDQSAHEGALRTFEGRTLAILGCGVDRVYPRENKYLYEQIQERGAVISEYALGAGPLAHHFPRRNRIISGLACATLVVEAHLRSGSLITAREALEQGRDVFAMPGRIDQLQARGVHRLIREGAVLIDSPELLMDELSGSKALMVEGRLRKGFAVNLTVNPKFSETSTETGGLSTDQRHLLDILADGPLCYDELIKKEGFVRGELDTLLLGLEMSHKIVKNSDGAFELKAK